MAKKDKAKKTKAKKAKRPRKPSKEKRKKLEKWFRQFLRSKGFDLIEEGTDELAKCGLFGNGTFLEAFAHLAREAFMAQMGEKHPLIGRTLESLARRRADLGVDPPRKD